MAKRKGALVCRGGCGSVALQLTKRSELCFLKARLNMDTSLLSGGEDGSSPGSLRILKNELCEVREYLLSAQSLVLQIMPHGAAS